MAKTKTFPDNPGIRARLDAIIDAMSSSRNALTSIRNHVPLPESTREIIGRQIDEALAACELASQAISGLE